MEVIYSTKVREGLKIKKGNYLVIGVKSCAKCKGAEGICKHRKAV